jgi:hypothetical protein
VLGLWGHVGPIFCHLDTAQGSRILSVQSDRPFDHVVLYASPLAASCEPYLARAWKNGETAGWTIRYRTISSF